MKITLQCLHFKGCESALVLKLQIELTALFSLPMEVQCKW